jgi:hypothetical protein
MKTDTLIDLLASQAGPAPRGLAARRLSPALAAGLLASAGVAVTAWGALPASAFATAAPWIKLVYAAALALAAAWWTARLSRPSAPCALPQRLTAAVVLTMLGAGAATLALTPADGRWQALLGESWLACPWKVLLLSLPALAVALWAVRGLAPTRPRRAGFAAGLLAGAAGAFGYSLSCPEASLTFVAVWYTLGIGLAGGVGALLGPRVLRW